MQVCTAMRTAAQRTPEADEQEAVSNLVTVVDFQLSLPALDSEDDEVSAPLPVISLLYRCQRFVGDVSLQFTSRNHACGWSTGGIPQSSVMSILVYTTV